MKPELKIAVIVSRSAVFSFLLFSAFPFTALAGNCCGSKAGGGPRVGAFTGTVASSADFLGDQRDDTLEYFASLYGYYGNSWSPDGHGGDPLGTGGKWPLIYARQLYIEQNVEIPGLLKRDLREQYVDFGYIPLWRYNTLSGYAKYRLSPELRATVQTVYGGEPGKPGTNANGSIGIGEVSLTWMPINVPQFWIKAGNIMDGGTYSPLFDQNPLENFLFTGAIASLCADIGGGIRSVSSLAIGGAFQNVTYLRDESWEPEDFPGFIHSTRQRTYAYVKSSCLIARTIGIKALGGVQAVPADSSPDVVGRYYQYDKSIGKMGGIEATYFGKHSSHTLTLSAATGDAPLGFGSPDYVIKALRPSPILPERPPAGQYSFTKEGSLCFNAIGWSGFEFEHLHLSAGVWYMARIPAKERVTMINPMPDSIRVLLPPSGLRDSNVLSGLQSRAVEESREVPPKTRSRGTGRRGNHRKGGRVEKG